MKKAVYMIMAITIAFSFSCGKKKKEIVREGLVNFFTGEVFLLSQGNRAQVKIGDVVREGMKIETGKKSTVEIYFGENAIKILEDTKVDISQLKFNQDGSESTSINVQNGKVFSKVAKKLSKSDNYNIHTPTAVASVRGTDFLVSEEKGKSKIACSDGKIEVKHEGETKFKAVELNGGQEVSVEKDKPLTVQDISADSKKNIENIMKNFQEARDDIRKKFEEQREEIRKAVADQKEANRKMIEDQKNLDKGNIDKQKSEDKARIEAIKGTAKEEQQKSFDAMEKQKEEGKKILESGKTDISKEKENFKPDLKKVKPDMK